MTPFDPRALRSAFGSFMTGVTVVTTRDTEGTPLGFTANSFTSVSLDPPLVLVCLANTSGNYAAFTGANGFAVNVLAETQKDISNTFARPSEDRFAAVDWRDGPYGAPVLEGVSAWFDCAMHRVIDAGDHAILLGEVKAFGTDPAPGLGYARGAYVTAAAEAQALDPQNGLIVSALIKRDHQVLMVEDGANGLTLPSQSVGGQSVSAALSGLIARTGVTADAGFIYSVYEDEVSGSQHITFLCEAEPDAEGAFYALTPDTLARVSDPALSPMLARFAAETPLGNFGVYYGNTVSGRVRHIGE